MFFPKNLTFLLKQKGINQRKLANLLGKKPAAVSEYTRGGSNPSVEGLLLIGKLLEVNLHELIYSDLEAESYGVIDEKSLSNKNNQIKTDLCFLTQEKCIFHKLDDKQKIIDELLKENERLKRKE